MSKYGYLVFHLREALKLIKTFKDEDDISIEQLTNIINMVKDEAEIG